MKKYIVALLIMGIMFVFPAVSFQQAFMTKTVTLQWNANTEDDLEGYKLYRALNSCTTGTPSALVIYKASTDFSGVQGQRGWSYRDSAGRNLTFDSVNNRWQGVETYLWLYATGGHPGNVADSVRRWVAPTSGNIQITGNARDTDGTGGGGVTVSILTGATVLWQQAIANGNTVGFNFNIVTTPVAAGQVIDFVINRGADGSNGWDSTAFDPTITLMSTGSTAARLEFLTIILKPAVTVLDNKIPVGTNNVCYALTAYDTSANESEFSNKVGKVVNFAPSSATNLKFK